MKRDLGKLAAAALSAAMIATGPAAAQKQGGILRAGHFDSPASMSMLEESTLAVNRPLMGVVQQSGDVRSRQAALQHFDRLSAGGRWIRTHGPSAKGKAMGSHSRQALPSRACTQSRAGSMLSSPI
jgi:hypothetical protein